MLMILARLVRSESFWAVAKVRSPHTGPGISYIIYPQPLPLQAWRMALTKRTGHRRRRCGMQLFSLVIMCYSGSPNSHLLAPF